MFNQKQIGYQIQDIIYVGVQRFIRVFEILLNSGLTGWKVLGGDHVRYSDYEIDVVVRLITMSYRSGFAVLSIQGYTPGSEYGILIPGYFEVFGKDFIFMTKIQERGQTIMESLKRELDCRSVDIFFRPKIEKMNMLSLTCRCCVASLQFARILGFKYKSLNTGFTTCGHFRYESLPLLISDYKLAYGDDLATVPVFGGGEEFADEVPGLGPVDPGIVGASNVPDGFEADYSNWGVEVVQGQVCPDCFFVWEDCQCEPQYQDNSDKCDECDRFSCICQLIATGEVAICDECKGYDGECQCCRDCGMRICQCDSDDW
jgi:hypothetical protein